jgi:hypothetical protein
MQAPPAEADSTRNQLTAEEAATILNYPNVTYVNFYGREPDLNGKDFEFARELLQGWALETHEERMKDCALVVKYIEQYSCAVGNQPPGSGWENENLSHLLCLAVVMQRWLANSLPPGYVPPRK